MCVGLATKYKKYNIKFKIIKLYIFFLLSKVISKEHFCYYFSGSKKRRIRKRFNLEIHFCITGTKKSMNLLNFIQFLYTFLEQIANKKISFVFAKRIEMCGKKSTKCLLFEAFVMQKFPRVIQY